MDFQLPFPIWNSGFCEGGSGSLACEALLLHTWILVTFNTGNLHRICLTYPRFFLMCKFSAEFPRMGFRKSWILMELKTCTRRTAYGNMYDTLWFHNTAIKSLCIIVLLVINIWMWTCTQCIIFCRVTSPASEVACLTWFDDVFASPGYLRVCSYSVFKKSYFLYRLNDCWRLWSNSAKSTQAFLNVSSRSWFTTISQEFLQV